MKKSPIPTQNELRESLKDLHNMGKPVCIMCGQLLKGEYHYCPNCGNGTEKSLKKPSVKWAFICIICRKEISEPFAKYCSNCGQKIRKQTWKEFKDGKG